jgi:hypothetical protein
LQPAQAETRAKPAAQHTQPDDLHQSEKFIIRFGYCLQRPAEACTPFFGLGLP